MPQSTLDLVRTTPHCGAEVRGLDLSRPMEEATSQALGRALAEHCVLFFRDQALTPESHKALGRRFGPLHLHPAF
ncbi:MAG TPA: TauD/TfdA family dioxygenase, partial [Burkholderiales bacterium]|nr:TauD/TfdA family dioxygenase [Burkholderiales bacterium]